MLCSSGWGYSPHPDLGPDLDGGSTPILTLGPDLDGVTPGSPSWPGIGYHLSWSGMVVPPVLTWDGVSLIQTWEGWGTLPTLSGRMEYLPSGRMGVPPHHQPDGGISPKCEQTQPCENSILPHPSDAGGNQFRVQSNKSSANQINMRKPQSTVFTPSYFVRPTLISHLIFSVFQVTLHKLSGKEQKK